MKFVIWIISLLACLFIPKNKIDPTMEVKAYWLRLEKLSMPFDKVITIIKFKLRVLISRRQLNVINLFRTLLNSKLKFLWIYQKFRKVIKFRNQFSNVRHLIAWVIVTLYDWTEQTIWNVKLTSLKMSCTFRIWIYSDQVLKHYRNIRVMKSKIVRLREVLLMSNLKIIFNLFKLLKTLFRS